MQRPAAADPSSPPVDARRDELVRLIRNEAPNLWGPSGAETIERIAAEHDELCGAVLDSLDAAPTDATQIADGLLLFWTITGRRHEGRALCERAAETSADPLQRIRFGLYAAQLARDEGDPAAAPALEELIAAARAQSDRSTVGLGLTILAPIAFHAGRMADAKQMASEALTLLRLQGPQRRVVDALNVLGNTATVEGDSPAAFAFYEDALAISREAGMKDVVCKVLLNLGSLSLGRSNLSRAREYYTEAREFALAFGDTLVASAALTNLGVIAKAEGDLVGARRLLDEALTLKRELSDVRGTAIVQQGLADIDLAESSYDSAQRLLRHSLKACRKLDFSLGMIAGLETFAGVLAKTGGSEVGLRIAAAADAARTATGQRRSPEDTAEFEGAVAALRDGASEDEAQTWWDEGGGLSLPDAVEVALALD